MGSHIVDDPQLGFCEARPGMDAVVQAIFDVGGGGCVLGGRDGWRGEDGARNGVLGLDVNGENASLETLLLRRKSAAADPASGLPLHFSLTYTLVPLFLSFTWLAIATHRLAMLTSFSPSTSSTPPPPSPLLPFLLTLIHLTAFLFSITSPSRPTPPYKILVLYFLIFLGALVTVGKDLHLWQVDSVPLERLSFAAKVASMALLGWVVVVGVLRPMAIPSLSIDYSKLVSPPSFTSFKTGTCMPSYHPSTSPSPQGRTAPSSPGSPFLGFPHSDRVASDANSTKATYTIYRHETSIKWRALDDTVGKEFGWDEFIEKAVGGEFDRSDVSFHPASLALVRGVN